MADLVQRRSERDVPDKSDRSPTRRDRDRILYSDPFRRLGGVTQVALGDPSFQLHNRLTHSLKVEQVGTSLHTMLSKRSGDFLDNKEADLHAIAAACLGHDIGHPPFGHAAEMELDSLLVCDRHKRNPRPIEKRRSDPCTVCTLEDGFEGNAQSFRVLAVLAVHRMTEDLPHGLDLTRASLRAVSKYPWVRNEEGRKPHKWGAYDCDAPVLEWAFDGLNNEPNIAAQIMDWADDISYAVHDLEDFYRTGHIPLEAYAKRKGHGDDESAALEEFLDYAQSPGAFGPVTKAVREPFYGFLALFPTTRFRGTPQDLSTLDRLRSRLLDQFIARSKYEDGMLVRQPTLDKVNGLLKQFIWFHIIDAPALDGIQQGQRKIIRDIFEDLRPKLEEAYKSGEAVEPSGRELRRLPYGLRRAVELGRLQKDSFYTEHQKLMRGLVDYVAGLSDLEAYRLHATLKGREGTGEIR